MWVRKRHIIVFAILRPIFRLFLHFRFGYKAEKHKLEKRPYLLLSNHQTTLDPFNIALSFKRYVEAISCFFIKDQFIIWLLKISLRKSLQRG